MKHFFVSYNRHDRAWAEWIASTLEEAGDQTTIQAWDFRAGGNFVLDMQKAAAETDCTIAVLSETYLTSEFTAPEWAAAFAQDPTGKKRKLIPVRVKECTLRGLLAPINYIDLVDLAEADAKDVLLRGVADGRARPDKKSPFPGSTASPSDRPKAVFPPSLPCNLPPVSAIFVGRDEDLEQLHAQMQTGTAIAISAVSGMGGIGKTELAAQYALQQRDMGTYPGGICWVKAREDLKPQLVLFAQSHLGLSIPEDLELPEQVAYCWRNWRPGQTLLVFDDVQAYQDVESVAIPQRSQFRVLLTTRLSLQLPVQNFAIKVLSEETAIALLQAFVARDRPDLRGFPNLGGLETAQQLCEWLGYLPLGIELVGRYLARRQDTSLETLWQRLQDKRLDAKVLKEATPEMTAPLGVAAAFELSWEVLDPPAQQLAALLSLFALAEIPWMLVEACLPEDDPETLEDCRDESLLNLHLLERTGQGMYQLHQLLREFFAVKREQMAEPNEMKQAVCRVMAVVAEQMPINPTRAQIEPLTAVIPHLKEVSTTLKLSLTDADLIKPSTRVAQFYAGQAAYSEALVWYERCLETAEARLGADHPDVAQSLNNLAELYRAQGRYTKAAPLYTRALDIWERQLGADHPAVAASLNNLALLYQAQGRYAEAEPLYTRALDIWERQLGADHPAVATSLNNLAGLYYAQGRYAEAAPLYTRALDICERQLGADHPNVAASLNNLALLYQAQGRYAEAAPLYTRALDICERQLGADHPHVATSLNSLALLYQAQGRYAEAAPLYTRALDIRERQLGADHPNVATSLNNLAELYKAQGRYAEAAPLSTRALDIWERQLGADHPSVATSLNNLAELYKAQGRYAEAAPLSTRALDIHERQLGADHPTVATSLNNLAALYESQGRYAEAEPLYTRALDINERQLGADHPDVATSLNNLAALYYDQGRYKEAEPLFLRALAILFEKLGDDHPNTQAGWQNFLIFLQQVMAAGQTAQLSEHSATQDVLRQMREGRGE